MRVVPGNLSDRGSQRAGSRPSWFATWPTKIGFFERCELAFVSVYATFAMLAWPLVTLMALSFHSKYEVDVVVQSVLVGGVLLGLLEYVRCTLFAVLDYERICICTSGSLIPGGRP